MPNTHFRVHLKNLETNGQSTSCYSMNPNWNILPNFFTPPPSKGGTEKLKKLKIGLKALSY